MHWVNSMLYVNISQNVMSMDGTHSRYLKVLMFIKWNDWVQYSSPQYSYHFVIRAIYILFASGNVFRQSIKHSFTLHRACYIYILLPSYYIYYCNYYLTARTRGWVNHNIHCLNRRYLAVCFQRIILVVSQHWHKNRSNAHSCDLESHLQVC